MTGNTIGSFFTKISNEVEKQMDDDLKSFGIDANELEFLIELNHHKHGKNFDKLVTDDKVKEIAKKLVTKDLITVADDVVTETEKGSELCKKVEKHRLETDHTITGMLSKEEILGLVNVLKKMLKKDETKD